MKTTKEMIAEPRKVMMQMMQLSRSTTLRAFPVDDSYSFLCIDWEIVGEPFEFVFPEEVK